MNNQNQVSRRSLSTALTRLVCASSFMLLQGMAFSEGVNRESVSVSKADSLKAAAAQAASDQAAARQDNINTILEVAGSVAAIIIIVFITWKMSAGSKSDTSKPVSGGTGSGRGESHQDIMARRMKMAKK
jgi:hypothetical protein